MRKPAQTLAVATDLIWGFPPVSVGGQQNDLLERSRQRSAQAEAEGLIDPFLGITTAGKVLPGLFPIRSTGVSTEPVRTAAAEFLAALTSEQRIRTVFAVDDPEWRKWMNQHFYVRQGVGFDEMTEGQREAATGLLRASLSARGLQLTRDVVRLTHTLGGSTTTTSWNTESGFTGSR